MKHVLEWSEVRQEWWVTTYNEAGEARSGRPLEFFVEFETHDETLDKWHLAPVSSR